jgi:uncharacterized metal-binding protein
MECKEVTVQLSLSLVELSVDKTAHSDIKHTNTYLKEGFPKWQPW